MVCYIFSDDQKCTAEGKPIFGKRTFQELDSIPLEDYHTSTQSSIITSDWMLRVVYGIFALKDPGVKSYAKVHMGLEEGRDYDGSNLSVSKPFR
jgi:hypothetical protein